MPSRALRSAAGGVLVGLAIGCRPSAEPTAPTPSPPATATATACGDGPACEGETTCVEYFPIADRPGPPVQACERTCSFAGDDCPAGQICAMESAGPGFVCRPVDEPELPADIERVVALAEIWSEIRVVHPWLAYREIDWDGALRRAIPKARKAQTDEAFRDVVSAMLAELGDPATRIVVPVGPPPDPPPAIRKEADGTLVITLQQVQPYDQRTTDEIATRLHRASRVVFDMRGLPGVFRDFTEIAFSGWNEALLGETVVLPTPRSRVTHGFAPEGIRTSGNYYSAFETRAAPQVVGERAKDPPRVAFVVDDTQLLPAVALPLWESGRGVVVASQPLDARTTASYAALPAPGGDGYLQIRTGELVDQGRAPILEADRVTTDDPLDAALALVRRSARPRRRQAKRQPLPPAITRPPVSRAVSTTADVPDAIGRMHAAIDLWSTLDWFQAYPDRRPRWDAALGRALAAMDRATDWEAYTRVMLELDASTDDGHSVLLHPQIDARRAAQAPFDYAVVEGCLIVTEILSHSHAEALEVGDVIMEIDGRPFTERFAELAPRTAASTPRAHRLRVADEIVRGPAKPPLALVVDRDGTRVELTVQRIGPRPGPRLDPVIRRVADGAIGVVDLRQLGPAEVPAMFEQLADTEAIIFDLRGYPKGTAWTIAPYLDRHPGPTPAAQIRRPRIAASSVGTGSDLSDPRTTYLQLLPEADVPRYDRPTLMLTNSRTISQAEHTGLFFEAANGTRFVGTPSAGANGDVTSHVLSDGTLVGFTGQAITSPSGRPLQRVGLPLARWVEPSIEGIRAGRDEVLQAAVELLRSEGVGRRSGER